jgi:hypothetical protein
MKRKVSVFLAIFSAFWVFVSDGSAVGQLSSEQVKNFRSAKTARVSVNQSYTASGNAIEVSLPFEDLARQLLKDSGLQVVESDVTVYDLHLKIEAKGKALGASYSGAGFIYSGASLAGVISLRTVDVPIYQNSFYTKIRPRNTMPAMFAPQLRAPSKAPFKLAFCRPGPDSFVKKLMEIIGDIYGIDALVAALKNHRNYRVRANAAQALGKINDPRVVETLIIALSDNKSGFFRSELVGALGDTKDPRAVEPLIAALRHPGSGVREEAAKSLGKIRDPRAVEPLISTLRGENDFQVRRNTAAALKSITGKDFGNDPKKWQAWWEKNKDRYPKNG